MTSKAMTSKERAALKAQASTMNSIFQVGKSSLTPQMSDAIRNAFHTRELLKLSVLKNCDDAPRELAELIAERTGSQVVQVIGRKIILYKENQKLHEKEKKQGNQSERKSISR